MNEFQSPSQKVFYHTESIQQAGIAALHANQAYFYKNRYYNYERILRKWEELMCNSPIIMHTMIFAICFFADILVSWEMNRDIMSSVQFFPGDPPVWAILLLCLLINGWAAITGHFIGKGWSKDIQDWERWNLTFIKHGGDVASHAADADIHREVWWAKFYGIISGLILFTLVGLIIKHRIEILAANAEIIDADPDSIITTVVVNPLVVIFFPVAILMGEFLTGFYIIYIVQRYWQKSKRSVNRRRFLTFKMKCGAADKLAHEYHVTAKEGGGNLDMVADLEVSLKRFKTRSQETDGYIDPVLIKKSSFILQFQPSGQPVARQFVYGVLANGAKTGHHRTDNNGQVTIIWSGPFDKIELLHIPGYPTQVGPYFEYSEHYIEIPDPNFVSSNGNGIHEPLAS